MKEKEQKAQAPAVSQAPSTPQMDSELKQEFQTFKAVKVINKLAMVCVTAPYAQDTVKSAVVKTKAGSYASVAVLPTAVKEAAKLMAGFEPTVCAVISYPHGEDVLKGKIVAAKTALSQNAEEVIVFAATSPVKRGDVKAVRKEADKLRGLGKRSGFRYAVMLDSLTESEKEKLFRAFKGYTCPLVLARVKGSVTAAEVAQAKSLAAGCEIEAMGEYRAHTEAVTVMEAGAARVWSPFADELAKGFAQQFEATISQAK